MPTFAFLISPAHLTTNLQRNHDAPLPPLKKSEIHSFGGLLDARVFFAQERSTSELLRTL